MWMKIKTAEINFDKIEAFDTGENIEIDNKNYWITFYFVSGGEKHIEFKTKKQRNEAMFQIRSKLTKHETIEISE